jgi:hypothetical protein
MAIPNMQLVQMIYDRVKLQIKNKQANTELIIQCCVYAMALVEQQADLSGKDKKAIVLQVCQMLVDEARVDNATKVALQLLVSTTLPHMIDQMISVANGETKLLQSKCTSCCVV